MVKPLIVHKHRGLQEFYTSWVPFHDYRYVIYGIEGIGEVSTISGPMVKVKLKQIVELINMNQDVAALVGRLSINGALLDLFYWNDKYWVKALDATSEWYKNQCNLLYEVNMLVTDEYIESLAVKRNHALSIKNATP